MAFKKYLGIAGKVISIGEEMLKALPMLEATPSTYDHRVLLLYFALRAKQNLEAIHVLCTKGYSIQAMMIARSTFELSVVLEYIQKDPKKRAPLFANYDIVERNRWLKKAEENKGTWPELLAGGKKKVQEQIRRLYSGVKADYQEEFHWAGPKMTIAKMCRELGAKSSYDFYYALLCQMTHNSPRCVKDHIEFEAGRGLLIKDGPNERYTKEALATASVYLLHILSILDDEFGLKRQVRLEHLLKELQ